MCRSLTDKSLNEGFFSKSLPKNSGILMLSDFSATILSYDQFIGFNSLYSFIYFFYKKLSSFKIWFIKNFKIYAAVPGFLKFISFI